VLYLLEALGLDRDDVVPLYLGDDITDEDAFEALPGKGIGISAKPCERASTSTSQSDSHDARRAGYRI
jgi:trehalose-6-phosphatase